MGDTFFIKYFSLKSKKRHPSEKIKQIIRGALQEKAKTEEKPKIEEKPKKEERQKKPVEPTVKKEATKLVKQNKKVMV